MKSHRRRTPLPWGYIALFAFLAIVFPAVVLTVLICVGLWKILHK